MVLKLGRRAVRRRDKRADLMSPSETYAFGVELMTSCTGHGELTDVQRAIEYRDGLLIAILSARPLRRGDMARIVVGEHLLVSGSGYGVVIREDEGKTSRHLDGGHPAISEDVLALRRRPMSD